MTVSKETTSKQIQDCIALAYHQAVSYQAAHRAKVALLDNTLEKHREAFQKLSHRTSQRVRSPRLLSFGISR